MLVAIAGALIVAAAAAYWFLSRRAASRPPPTRDNKAATQFSSVEIRLRSNACPAARALKGQRFLAKEAPTLPLPGCSAAQCSCSFAKLSDRRTDGRRLEHDGLSAAMFLTTNRRQKRDRRHAERSSKTR
jgi:hypothetical protein